MDQSGEGCEFVIATYREIAEHFGYRGKQPDNVARMKAKRAGWLFEPQNHPLETVRVRVPREAWEGASAARDRGLAARRAPALKVVGDGGDTPNAIPLEPPQDSPIKALSDAVVVLREQLGLANARAERAEERADRLEQERDAIRAEFNAWTAGGPLVRAWRAFLNRRR
jgi:hypothetical protein